MSASTTEPPPASSSGTAGASTEPFAYFSCPAENLTIFAAGAQWLQKFAGKHRFTDALREVKRIITKDKLRITNEATGTGDGDADGDAAGSGVVGSTIAGINTFPLFFTAFPFESEAAGTVFLPRRIIYQTATPTDTAGTLSRSTSAEAALYTVLQNYFASTENNEKKSTATTTTGTTGIAATALQNTSTGGMHSAISNSSLVISNSSAPAGILREIGGDWFEPAVQRALSEIERGTISKVVLARSWQTTLTPTPISNSRSVADTVFNALTRLRERFPNCHTYAFCAGTGEPIFFGATPERLVQRTDSVAGGITAVPTNTDSGRLHPIAFDSVRVLPSAGDTDLAISNSSFAISNSRSVATFLTEAVAGTVPRSTDAAKDSALAAALLLDPKELREHSLVADAILDTLRSLGLPPTAGSPEIVSLPNVHHLRTRITAQFPTTTAPHILDLAAALHPTPATGGTPPAAALALIRGLEPTPRNYFAGPLGWFDAAGAGRLLVGLRGATIDTTGTATFHAGAGIVVGTDPSREAAETRAKLRAITSALESP